MSSVGDYAWKLSNADEKIIVFILAHGGCHRTLEMESMPIYEYTPHCGCNTCVTIREILKVRLTPEERAIVESFDPYHFDLKKAVEEYEKEKAERGRKG